MNHRLKTVPFQEKAAMPCENSTFSFNERELFIYLRFFKKRFIRNRFIQ